MLGIVEKYTKWLHTRWPDGVIEELPLVNEDYSTNVPGLYIVGDVTGIPLLKFSSDSGARAVKNILADKDFKHQESGQKTDGVLDLVIVGAGVSGMAAALEARRAGLSFEIIEASEPFSTVVNFPKGKPIYTYPRDMIPAGDLQFSATVKEPLADELKEQTLGRGIEPRSVFGIQINCKWVVDLFLVGIIGYGVYFWFSGRVWCTFACPLAALMHIYARFSRFRILADKKKCISCNVCTSVCHQGIDVMNFANKGLPMEDPECVRCSARLQSCPTGVLQFGQINRKTGRVLKVDSLQASPVLMREQ